MRFVDRIGRALVRPREALEATDRGEGGSSDALALLALKLLCGEARALVVAGWALVVVGPRAAFPALLSRLSSALGVDLVLMLIAGIGITLAAGKKRSPGRDFDMACTAWIPVLVVDAAASLAATVASVELPGLVVDLVWTVALLWMGAMCVLAVRVARARS